MRNLGRSTIVTFSPIHDFDFLAGTSVLVEWKDQIHIQVAQVLQGASRNATHRLHALVRRHTTHQNG
jgi:hypothetical protein